MGPCHERYQGTLDFNFCRLDQTPCGSDLVSSCCCRLSKLYISESLATEILKANSESKQLRSVVEEDNCDVDWDEIRQMFLNLAMCLWSACTSISAVTFCSLCKFHERLIRSCNHAEPATPSTPRSGNMSQDNRG